MRDSLKSAFTWIFSDLLDSPLKYDLFFFIYFFQPELDHVSQKSLGKTDVCELNLYSNAP